MNRTSKIILVLAGYGLALLVAAGAAWLADALQSSSITQGSQGMSAFGGLLFFAGAFALLCIPPTLLGLWFLRKSILFWNLASLAVLALAVTAPLAEGVRAFILKGGFSRGYWDWLDLAAMLRTFATPFLALGFGLCAFIAPTAKTRWALATGALLEAVTALYLGYVLFFFHRFV